VQDNVDRIHLNHNMLLWHADVKTVTNLRVPNSEEDFLSSSKYVGFLSKSLLHEFPSFVHSYVHQG